MISGAGVGPAGSGMWGGISVIGKGEGVCVLQHLVGVDGAEVSSAGNELGNGISINRPSSVKV
jgi:hypothetical protein